MYQCFGERLRPIIGAPDLLGGCGLICCNRLSEHALGNVPFRFLKRLRGIQIAQRNVGQDPIGSTADRLQQLLLCKRSGAGEGDIEESKCAP